MAMVMGKGKVTVMVMDLINKHKILRIIVACFPKGTLINADEDP